MEIGMRIGRYEVRRQLGRGAFATVYAVHDETLESDLALKLLDPAMNADLEVRERFIQEARLLRRAAHPRLVQIYDIGETGDGQAWFVMTRADRGTLADRLEQSGGAGRATEGDVATLAFSLADGLAALHGNDVVHRDITPRNLLLASGADETSGRNVLRPDEQILIADLGLAKDLAQGTDLLTMLGGTPRYQAPEQTTALAAIDPRTDLYAATAVVFEFVTGSLPPLAHERRGRLAELTEPWRRFVEQGMALDPGDRFDDVGQWHNSLRTLIEHGVHAVAPLPRADVVNPYPGLAAYRGDRAGFFSGREAMVDELVERLRTDRAVVVGGASGAGKSSLLHAGLSPAVTSGVIDPDRTWEVVSFSPGTEPIERLLRALDPLLSEPVSTERLADDPTRLGAALERPDRSVLVIVDQFEEVVTQAADPDLQSLLVASLQELAEYGASTRVVLAVRADFYGLLGHYPWLGGLLRGHVFVGPMQPAELRRAIERPALRAGGTVDDELVEAVLSEARDASALLPHLSHALAQAWSRRSGSRLTLQDYRDLGGVAGALTATAEDFVGSLDGPERDLLRPLLLSMVTSGRQGRPDARGTVDLARLSGGERALVDRLTDARLVTVEDDAAQLAHEALLSGWPTLAAWIDDGRSELATEQAFREAAFEWHERGRAPDLLQRGAVLEQTTNWLTSSGSSLDRTEQAFLDVSRQRQQRSARIRQAVTIGLATLLVAATIGALVAWRQSVAATDASELANSRRLAAESANALTRNDRQLASLLAVAGEQEASTVEVRRALLAAAVADLDDSMILRGHEGDVRALAAGDDGLLASGGVDGTIHVWPSGGESTSFRAHDQEVRGVAFLPGRGSLVSAGADGWLRQWDAATGDLVVEHQLVAPNGDGGGGSGDGEGGSGDGGGQGGDGDSGQGQGGNGDGDSGQGQGGNGDGDSGQGQGQGGGSPGGGSSSGLRSVSASPDGSTVVVAGEGGLWIWAVDDGEPRRLLDHPTGTRAVAFHPDGDRVAFTDRSGLVAVASVPDGELLGERTAHQDVALGISWAEGGRRIVSSGRDRTLHWWDVETGETTTFAAHAAEIYALATDPAGTTVASVSADRLVVLWDSESGERVDTLRGHEGDVRAVAFAADGSLATASTDQTVRRWSEASTGHSRTLGGNRAGVLDLAADADHGVVVAATRAGQIVRWHPEEGSDPVLVVEAHDDLANAVALVGDDVISAGQDGRLVRTGPDGDPDVIADLGTPLRSMALSPDGARVVVGGNDQTVTIVDLASGDRTTITDQHSGAVRATAWSTDGTTIAAGSETGRVTLHTDDGEGWSEADVADTGREVRTIAFDPLGRYLAIGGAGTRIRIHEVDGQELVTELTGHTGPVHDLDWTADGAHLVSVSRDQIVRIVDRTFEEVASARVHAEDNRAVHAGSGTTIATASNGGDVRLWPGPTRWVDVACQIAGRDLSADERTRFLGSDDQRTYCSG